MAKPTGRPGKINLKKLEHLFALGRTDRECAEYFSVSVSAIGKARKRALGHLTRNTCVQRDVEAIRAKHLDTIGQLEKINGDANEILDLLMRWNRGDEEALRVLESQTKKVVFQGKNGEDSELDITEIKSKDPRELALKAMAEIRNQLRLQMDIYQMLYDVKAAEEFQKEIVTAIGEVAPDVRDRILCNLRKKRAIYAAIRFD